MHGTFSTPCTKPLLRMVLATVDAASTRA